MLTPLMNKKKKKLRLIVAGILLGLFQIIHFLHFFSLFNEIKYIEDIYDIISGDKILETLFSRKDDSETIPFFEDTELNLAKIIHKESRKKFLKIYFRLICGLSYSNSFFTLIQNCNIT